VFAWIENTPVAIWVSVSLWGYPFLLSLHAVGLAVVVGIFSVRDMRLLGLFRGLQPAAFLYITKISGILLFTSQAATFVNNTSFLVKIGFVIAGMILAQMIQSRLSDELAGASGDVIIGKSTKLIALASLSCWVAAIIAGRLVAYT
jgi:hypothetical protein